MSDTDVQATNTECKSILSKNCKLEIHIWLVNHNVVSGSTKMIQEHVAFGKIRFWLHKESL